MERDPNYLDVSNMHIGYFEHFATVEEHDHFIFGAALARRWKELLGKKATADEVIDLYEDLDNLLIGKPCFGTGMVSLRGDYVYWMLSKLKLNPQWFGLRHYRLLANSYVSLFTPLRRFRARGIALTWVGLILEECSIAQAEDFCSFIFTEWDEFERLQTKD